MSKRGAGVAFCWMAAFLFSTWYIVAVIYAKPTSHWSRDAFATALDWLGPGLPLASAFALLLGIVYLIQGNREG